MDYILSLLFTCAHTHYEIESPHRHNRGARDVLERRCSIKAGLHCLWVRLLRLAWTQMVPGMEDGGGARAGRQQSAECKTRKERARRRRPPLLINQIRVPPRTSGVLFCPSNTLTQPWFKGSLNLVSSKGEYFAHFRLHRGLARIAKAPRAI